MGERNGIGGQVKREEWVPRSDSTVISCLPPPLSPEFTEKCNVVTQGRGWTGLGTADQLSDGGG